MSYRWAASVIDGVGAVVRWRRKRIGEELEGLDRKREELPGECYVLCCARCCSLMGQTYGRVVVTWPWLADHFFVSSVPSLVSWSVVRDDAASSTHRT
jgi:hypothetical protein